MRVLEGTSLRTNGITNRCRTAFGALLLATAVLLGVAARAADPFEELALELPTARPTGQYLDRVAFLGLREGGDTQQRIISWLLPRRPDSVKIETRLLTALVDRYHLEEGWVPEEARAEFESLLAFGSRRSEIAHVNASLGIDAVVVVHYESVPSWPGDLASSDSEIHRIRF